ncbi:MAG: hypothetical protein QOC96_1386 [Acidobacteriota bacterium]|jgi:hypothetical protein|nr:hypothetical protein [Acidobacteriota bacterium]
MTPNMNVKRPTQKYDKNLFMVAIIQKSPAQENGAISCLAFCLSNLSENISDLIYQAFIFKVFGFDFGELFEDAALLAR